MIRYLTESDVQKLLTMPLALEAMEQAHKALAEHRAIDVPRARIHLPAGTQHVLQAAAPELGYIGFKYYYTRPQNTGAILQKFDSEPAGKDFRRLWQLTPREVVDELFECEAVRTLVLSQMAIPRGVGVDYAGGGIEVLKMIAGDEKPELARGGAHSIA